jgi:hypothetical protein
MNNYELTLLNLKIISKIPKNGKIARDSTGIIIEFNNIPLLTSLKRFYYGDSRKKAIHDINNIINNAIDIVEQKKILCDNENGLKVNTIIFHLEKCIIGLNNLKVTYINDITMSSKIDILITKIHNYIEIFRSFVPQLLPDEPELDP